jgi:hypothetical protein
MKSVKVDKVYMNGSDRKAALPSWIRTEASATKAKRRYQRDGTDREKGGQLFMRTISKIATIKQKIP